MKKKSYLVCDSLFESSPETCKSLCTDMQHLFSSLTNEKKMKKAISFDLLTCHNKFCSSKLMLNTLNAHWLKIQGRVGYEMFFQKLWVRGLWCCKKFPGVTFLGFNCILIAKVFENYLGLCFIPYHLPPSCIYVNTCHDFDWFSQIWNKIFSFEL